MKEDSNPYQNPTSKPSIIQVLSNLTGPRSEKSLNYRHPLTTIMFITIVCSLCGSNDWETIVVQANAMRDWLGCFVDVSRGIPCARTFIRVFNSLNPNELNGILARIARDLGLKGEEEVISFDGKTMRGIVRSPLIRAVGVCVYNR